MGQAFECDCGCGALVGRYDVVGTVEQGFDDTWIEVMMPDMTVSPSGRAFVSGPYHFGGIEHLERFITEDQENRMAVAEGVKWTTTPHDFEADPEDGRYCGKCGLREDEEPHVSET